MKKIEKQIKKSLNKIIVIIRLASTVLTNFYCKILSGLCPNIQQKKIVNSRV